MRFERRDLACRACSHSWSVWDLADFNAGDGILKSRSGLYGFVDMYQSPAWTEASEALGADRRLDRYASYTRRDHSLPGRDRLVVWHLASALVLDRDPNGHPYFYEPACPRCGAIRAAWHHVQGDWRTVRFGTLTESAWRPLTAEVKRTYLDRALDWAIGAYDTPEGHAQPRPPPLPV
jgi:hypothetical protein